MRNLFRLVKAAARVSALAALFTCLALPGAGAFAADELRLLAGAGLRHPTDLLVEEFKRSSGITVYVDYGGSGQLMTRLLASNRGDLYMPGSYYYIKRLEKLGKVISSRPIVLHTPVLAVNRAKAELVRGLDDLARPGLRVGLGDPQAMAMGRLAEDILGKAGLMGKVAPNIRVRTATVKQLALYVARGYVDAAIIARADAVQFKDQVVMVDIPRKYFRPEVIGAALLKTSKAPEAARRLQDFLSSDRAKEVFIRYGFLPLSATPKR